MNLLRVIAAMIIVGKKRGAMHSKSTIFPCTIIFCVETGELAAKWRILQSDAIS